jgi:hypothetical protein
MNKITENLTKKQHTIAIFCDLRKAFDTVDHFILFKKLGKLGVRGVELDWFKSYLSGRQQFVTNNGVASNLLHILLGVPQGSILGPLLFLIYINDLPLCSDRSLLFADNTTLSDSDSNIDTLFSRFNSEFKKVVYFFRAHKLALHPNKTKFMIFSHSNAVLNTDLRVNIDFNNFPDALDQNLIKPIELVNKSADPVIKFLGVYFDPSLSFKTHISTISSKMS